MPITRQERAAIAASPLDSALLFQEEPMPCQHEQHARAGLCPGCGRWNYGSGYSSFGDPLELPTAEEIRQAYRVASEMEKEARYADALVALARCRLALGLLNSMVCSGEQHSDTSRHVVTTALASIELAVRR